MCGINGYIDHSKKLPAEVLEKMTSVIAHRGPDGQGIWHHQSAEANIAFGHRRLSIIDLSHSADQPMHFGNFTIVFNGEIYNYKEIKEKLLAFGRTFSTHSDTEVIVRAFDEWKEKCVEQFIGMFAFVIYDRKTEDVWMFRDRTGIKPLYWYQNGKVLMFASELKCFHEHPYFQKELNLNAVAYFLQYGSLPDEYKDHKGTKKYIIKQIVHQYVPKEIMEYPKIGFGIPVLTWMQTSLKTRLDYFLGESYIKQQNIFNFHAVNNLKENVLSGKTSIIRNYGMF